MNTQWTFGWGSRTLDKSPRADGFRPSALQLCQSRGSTWLNPEAIVHRAPKLLFAPQVPLRRLNRDVSQKKLNLVQFVAGKMAQPRTCAAQIMRRQAVQHRHLGMFEIGKGQNALRRFLLADS